MEPWHEGHLSECCAAAGASGAEVAAAVAARTHRCNLAYETLADVIAALHTHRGIAVAEAITSGTPGFMVRARASWHPC